MSSRKPDVGQTVHIRSGSYDDDPWVTAEVLALLSVQFTCHVVGTKRTTLFAFYSEHGVTWKFAE